MIESKTINLIFNKALGQASALVVWATLVKEQLDKGQLQVDELLKIQ